MGDFLSGTATIFSRLVDHSVEISALICLIFFVKWIAAKKLPPWWHYSLWLMLLVRMLVPIEFENRLNVFNFIPDIREHQVFETIAASSSESERSAAEITFKTPQNRPDLRFLLKNLLPMLWVVGAMVFGISILFKSASFWRSVRRLPPITDKEVLHLLAQCKNRMKIRAVIEVIVTDKVRSPALFGYFHPRLLLPKGIFERLSDEDLSYAFMHELGHLKRHDIGVSWLVAVLQAAYWFNPLVWVAFYQMRIDQESACDASVLSRIKRHQSADYAKAIVGFLEKFYQNCQLPSLAGVLENKTQMKRRIADIVHYKKYSQKLTVVAIALFFFTGFIFYLFTGVAKGKHTQSVMEPEVEKSFVEVKSVVDGEDNIKAEIIPAGFPALRSEVTQNPLYLLHDDISYAYGEAGNILEVLREDHLVYPNHEALKPSEEPEQRTVKTSPPVLLVPQRKTETESYKRQPEETRASSLMASLVAPGPGSISPGASPVKPDEEFAEKRGIEANLDTSVPGSGPDDSDQYPVYRKVTSLPVQTREEQLSTRKLLRQPPMAK